MSGTAYRQSMTDRASFAALRNMTAEVETLISTTESLPENRTPRSLELLRAALALADDLLSPVEEGRERYSPARFVAVATDAVTGMPDLDWASTSHVERKNGSLSQ